MVDSYSCLRKHNKMKWSLLKSPEIIIIQKIICLKNLWNPRLQNCSKLHFFKILQIFVSHTLHQNHQPVAFKCTMSAIEKRRWDMRWLKWLYIYTSICTSFFSFFLLLVNNMQPYGGKYGLQSHLLLKWRFYGSQEGKLMAANSSFSSKGSEL